MDSITRCFIGRRNCGWGGWRHKSKPVGAEGFAGERDKNSSSIFLVSTFLFSMVKSHM